MASRLYNALEADEIRVVRIPPSAASDGEKLLSCRLDVERSDGCLFETLSYCWGKQKNRQDILLNGELFGVTPDLKAALEELRQPETTRTIWIDAICINQSDNVEKGVQVSKMRDTYRSASQTVVWVGKAKDGTEMAFKQIRKLFQASDDDKEAIWSEPGTWAECLNEIIQRPYWTRAWTVQEVVVSRDSLLYCGPFNIPFFELAAVLIHPTARKHLNVTYSMYSYLKTAFEMRLNDWYDPKLGLFALAYSFRHRQCSNRLDRVYAFRGLLKSEASLVGDAAKVDYEQSEETLWRTLVKETMSRHRTLLPLALAEKAPVIDATWCVNFSHKFYDPNSFYEDQMLFWSGGLDDPRYFPLQSYHFSAADGLEARIDVDLEAPSVISVQGFIYDEIVAVGPSVNYYLAGFGRPNYVELFTAWEILVGGPWDCDMEPDPVRASYNKSMKKKFALTVTGGAWREEPIDWRAWNQRNFSQRPWDWRYWRFDDWDTSDSKSTAYMENRRGDSGDQSAAYEHVRDDACEGRRLVILKGGGFGLASQDSQVGDKLAILLGCDVPIVLHQRDWSKWHKRITDIENKRRLYGKTWKVIGQAYVHEAMHYKGDLEKDIESGKVVLETFLLD